MSVFISADTIEFVRSWISPVALTAILGIVLKYQIGMRKLKIDSDLAGNQNEHDIRDHYATEVRVLRDRLDAQSERYSTSLLSISSRHAEEKQDSERRHADCLRERELLLDQIRALKDLVLGLRRIIAQAAQVATVDADNLRVEDALADLESVERLFAEREKEALS